MKSVSGLVRGGLLAAFLGAALSACAVYEPAPYYAEPAYSYYPAPRYYYPAPAPSFSFSYVDRDGDWGHDRRRHRRHWH